MANNGNTGAAQSPTAREFNDRLKRLLASKPDPQPKPAAARSRFKNDRKASG